MILKNPKSGVPLEFLSLLSEHLSDSQQKPICIGYRVSCGEPLESLSSKDQNSRRTTHLGLFGSSL